MADVNDEDPPAPSESKKPWGPITACFVIALFAFVLAPIGWVLAYRVAPIPGTMLMVDRAFEGERVTVQWANLSDVSPGLVRAAIGAEDSRFCSHDGFDFEAIENAIKLNAQKSNQKRGRMRGGSTISQQTAKNVFAWADRSWARKGLETYYTLLIETLWPKERIMEAYLNVAEWGEGRFGAQAAAQGLFGVDAKALSERQAAALASVLPSPNKWSAVNPGRYVRSRIGAIMSRARVVGGDGLARCVLGGAGPAATPKGQAPVRRDPLPPLPAPPPSEAPSGDMGVDDAVNAPMSDAAEPTPEAPSSAVEDGPAELRPSLPPSDAAAPPDAPPIPPPE